MSYRRLTYATLVLGAMLAWTNGARADVGADRLAEALTHLPDGGARVTHQMAGPVPSVLLRVDSRAAARAAGSIPITDTLAVRAGSLSAGLSATGTLQASSATIAMRRFPQLDVAAPTIRLGAGQNDSGLMGEGVIVGIVDTGADASHPALRNADGTTRIKWLLAFGRDPRGLHPEMEEAYGCLGEDPCAVYSAADLNQILESRILSSLPKDPIGHGTHIASLAAGGDDQYPGVAPLADLVVVLASDLDGGVSDARILLGTKFIFDRAREDDQPAVVNVSLGSNFGAHDGTSSLEMGLSELARGPGRAVVIASGNSGEVFAGDGSYPGPWGVHSKVAVLPGSTASVPVITPSSRRSTIEGSFFVWISTNPGDHLSVGFENGEGASTELVPPKSTGGLSSKDFKDEDDYDVIIINGVDDELDADVLPTSAVVAVVGTWESGRAFRVTLSGRASASMWVSGQGEVGVFQSGVGPLLPRAQKRGTVTIPGTDPNLITVGATNNRSEWTDFTGASIGFSDEDGEKLAHFSSAGPNQLGELKPELVAPGGGVIGAMAAEADPRTSLDLVSQFASGGACPGTAECLVVDDDHAVSSGTSMAAPLATGTIALLMQRDPSLTMKDAKRYLMAGAHGITDDLGSLSGTGELDVVGSLRAQEEALAKTSGPPSSRHSRIVWSSNFVHPDVPQVGYLVLRDADDRPAAYDEDQVILDLEGPGTLGLTQQTAGLLRISVSASRASSGRTLTIRTRVAGTTIETAKFVIERDPNLAEHGYELVGGTCSLGPRPGPSDRSVWLTCGLLVAFNLGRRRIVLRRAPR